MGMSEIVSLSIFRFVSYLVLIITFHKTIHAQIPDQNNYCPPSSCGNLHKISFPFRLKTDPQNCGDPDYELSCENNVAVLNLSVPHKLHVKEINYGNYTIRVVDPDFQKNNCSTLPRYSLSKYNIFRETRFETKISYYPVGEVICKDFLPVNYKRVSRLTETAIFLTCKKPIAKRIHRSHYIDRAPCIDNSDSALIPQYYSYVVLGGKLRFSDLEESCRIDKVTLISAQNGLENLKNVTSYIDVYDQFLCGFELSWVQAFSKGTYCYVNELSTKVHCLHSCGRWYLSIRTTFLEAQLAIRMILIAPLIALLLNAWLRRHLSMFHGIEEFLQNHKDSMPVRYHDWEIRRMTNDFKDKLGEGGFGSVYKGKISNGRLVAVKVLGNSKSNGQDFINEVSTIGRVHHVNVVPLIGFFVKGSNRALIYEYMSKGSLDKYIFSREEMNESLSHKELFRISLGVARGIEYLHRGCDMRILHFDIKPHNILLDENFVPKVSDFGLARTCPSDDSELSLTAARGTMGYIAPELFYKNIGGVSHKADVYSFGMLLMEMANKRRNVNADADRTSQIYFPTWVYDQIVSNGKGLAMENSMEESELAKKMIVVALWCIQLKPSDRPSMSKVIEMLEGEFKHLQMPPKPCLYPQEQEEQENRGINDATGSSGSSLEEGSEETTLISNAYYNQQRLSIL